ncbi:alpha/beta hydrolase [Streptomyces sp. NPDC056716]|uniref:alpha/beta hydrolase n=1 Tax=unclassified Streptomyces TaxID=2593676 RepID=UPI00367CE10A
MLTRLLVRPPAGRRAGRPHSLRRRALRHRAVIAAAGLALLGTTLPATAAEAAPTGSAASTGSGKSTGPGKSKSAASRTSVQRARTTERAEPDLTSFYRQKVTWAACQGEGMPRDLQCGKVTVPLDYAKPASGTLELALARFRATGDKRGSVVLNFGGPGGSGVTELAYGGEDFMNLTDGYDVVSFDPRGVGRSAPVTCGTAAYETDSGSAAADSADPLSDPEALLRQLRAAAAECAKHSGPVQKHIGTVDVSRDLDVIRQALGDRTLNYLGFSYGTRLGAVYAAQFPDKVGRIALDGVDTLTEPLTEQGIAGAKGQQTALDDFLNWCTGDVACPFGTDPRRAREDVVQLVRSLDEDPVPTTFSGPFTGQDLVAAIGTALYSEELWPLLERALASLMEDGDTRGVESFTGGGMTTPGGTPVLPPKPTTPTPKPTERTAPTAKPTTPATQPTTPTTPTTPAKPTAPGVASRPAPDATQGTLTDAEDVPMDNLPAALVAVNCADDPDRPGAERITGDLARLRSAYQQASPVFGTFRLTQVLLCYGRPQGTDFIREQVKDVDSAKMLLVGTRGDPATPYRWTEQTAKRLGDAAVVLDNKGDGHTGYASSKCVRGKVDAFLLYGSLPPTGSSCGDEDDG